MRVQIFCAWGLLVFPAVGMTEPGGDYDYFEQITAIGGSDAAPHRAAESGGAERETAPGKTPATAGDADLQLIKRLIGDSSTAEPAVSTSSVSRAARKDEMLAVPDSDEESTAADKGKSKGATATKNKARRQADGKKASGVKTRLDNDRPPAAKAAAAAPAPGQQDEAVTIIRLDPRDIASSDAERTIIEVVDIVERERGGHPSGVTAYALPERRAAAMSKLAEEPAPPSEYELLGMEPAGGGSARTGARVDAPAGERTKMTGPAANQTAIGSRPQARDEASAARVEQASAVRPRAAGMAAPAPAKPEADRETAKAVVGSHPPQGRDDIADLLNLDSEPRQRDTPPVTSGAKSTSRTASFVQPPARSVAASSLATTSETPAAGIDLSRKIDAVLGRSSEPRPTATPLNRRGVHAGAEKKTGSEDDVALLATPRDKDSGAMESAAKPRLRTEVTPVAPPPAKPAVPAATRAGGEEEVAPRVRVIRQSTAPAVAGYGAGPSAAQQGLYVYGPTKPGSKLEDIADSLIPSNDISLNHMMWALYVKNPNAFVNGDIWRLKEHYILNVPDLEELYRIGEVDAEDQMALLRETRRK